MKRYAVRGFSAAGMPHIKAWHLDFPQAGVHEPAGLQGWVFPDQAGETVEIRVIEDGTMTFRGSPQIPAPGAKRAVFGETPSEHDDLARFSIPVQPSSTRIELYFSCAGEEAVAAEISVQNVFKVQEGSEGHLFLDNDTNRSVDQFTGRYLLDGPGEAAWREYLEKLAELDRDRACARLMICPAKEEIFTDLYPHERARRTPVDQILELADPELILFPVETLAPHRDRAFSKIDTHWSDYGACLGAAAYLRRAGLEAAVSALPQRFVDHVRYGDLGGKVAEKRTGVFAIIDPEILPKPSFDNGIGNHGRIWVYDNDEAPVRETLLLFGDSYSVSMAALLSFVFRRVVYVYSAATVYDYFLETERPAYILCQTNQRFVMGPPRFKDSFRDRLLAKKDAIHLTRLTPGEGLEGLNAQYHLLMQSLS